METKYNNLILSLMRNEVKKLDFSNQSIFVMTMLSLPIFKLCKPFKTSS